MKRLSIIERTVTGLTSNELRLWLLCFLASAACASDKTVPGTRSMDAHTIGASASSSNPAASGTGVSTAAGSGAATTPPSGSNASHTTSAAGANGAAGATATLMRPPPPASGCQANALDQTGCACDRPTATRPCYSADPKTRNVGMCKDGIQTCEGATGAGVEFGGQWGPCKEQVAPSECKEQLDARCVGKVGCEDAECMTKLGCAKDAGMPDAGNRHCITVMGWGQGTGFFPDGGMWCER